MENEIKKKSMLSGIQPSGDLHLGNYGRGEELGRKSRGI